MTTDSPTTQSDAAPASAPVDAPAPSLPNLLGDSPQGDSTIVGGGESTAGDQSTAGEGDATSAGDATTSGDSTAPGDSTDPAGADTLALTSYDSLAIPEGMIASDSLLSDFKAFALENKLPPAQAQRLIDMQSTAAHAQAAAQLEAFTTTQNEWIAEYRAWPEFTGTKATEATTASLGKLFEEFGTPEVREVMSITGAGNHPALIRMMLNISKALEEGGPTAPGRPNGAKPPRTLGAVLYPNQPQS